MVIRRRTSPPDVALRCAVALIAGLSSACGDGTGPRAVPVLSVAFLDAGGRLNTARSGEPRVVTPVSGLPYASTRGAVALWDAAGLRLYHVADGSVDTLPVERFAYRTPGAISPDGSMMAYAARGSGAAAGAVYLVMLRLGTGEADSMRVSGREDAPAAAQIEFSTPIFSPSGDSVAFLLPNQIGMQLFLFERATRRIEVFPVPVQVSTYFQPLPGWPRWTRDATIRFLTRLRLEGVPTDTLVVLEIFPRQPQMLARAAYRGAPADGAILDNAGAYSFDAEGRAVAFAMTTGGQTGIFALRQGRTAFETMVLEAGLFPRYPIVVP